MCIEKSIQFLFCSSSSSLSAYPCSSVGRTTFHRVLIENRIWQEWKKRNHFLKLSYEKYAEDMLETHNRNAYANRLNLNLNLSPYNPNMIKLWTQPKQNKKHKKKTHKLMLHSEEGIRIYFACFRYNFSCVSTFILTGKTISLFRVKFHDAYVNAKEQQ